MDTTESAASVPAITSETRVSTDTQHATKKNDRGAQNRQSRKRKHEKTNEGMKKKQTRGTWDGSTRRERNIDSRAEEGDEGEKEERRPKKKVACFVGYSGEGYHGMQYNPPMKTIEGEIYEAFAKAGAILKANAIDPSKSSFQRAARTDKGVHAAGNLISLKIMMSDDIVEKVNSYLPPQIRIWGIQRTNNAFNSHLHCDSRVYEYILPSHCFLPPKPGSTAAECARTFKSEERPREPEDTFWDNIIGPDFYSLLRRYTSNRKDVPVDNPPPDLSPEELERFNKIRSAETEAIRSFRLSASRLDRIRSAFKIYLGTHNFHNLTVGVPYSSSHAQRYMMSIDVAEPKLIGSTEWLRIKIHGQSFMLHQIRKMIGAVLIAIRYGVGEESIRHTLTTKENMHIPKAPAQGLLLERPVFSGMKQKLEKFGNEALDWEPYTEEIEKFKDEFIYKSIFRETTAENVYFAFPPMPSVGRLLADDRFHEFINFMDSFKYEEGKGLSMFLHDRQNTELVEKFEENEDEDDTNIKGDSDKLEG